MFKDIMFHELKNIINSPKFSAAFIACTLLILLSVFTGIQHYKSAVSQYETLTTLTKQEMREQSDWMGLTNKVLRRPDPMQIFTSGINDDIGRYSNISGHANAKLVHSVFSDDPVYSVFRFIDFSFIVVVVLSLMALLFSYDLVNGEAERGTLQLVFSNAVPRARFILAKLTGAWLGLVVPLLIPLLLSVLLLMIYSVPFTSKDWVKLFSLYTISIFLFTFFISLGALVSTLTKRSQVSFLIALVCWVCFVFILPRAGVIIAGQFVYVPSVAQIESTKDAYEKSQWDSFYNASSLRWAERNKGQENWTKEQRDAYRDEHMWEWMEQEENERKIVNANIEKFNISLQEDQRNRLARQEKLAFLLSRFSPISAYQIAAMNISETDLTLKTRYEDAINNYRSEFIKYTDKKKKESGAIGGLRIMMSSDGGMKIDADNGSVGLNISDMPQFSLPSVNTASMFKSTVVDAGIILASIILAFAFSFFKFLRYDVR